MRVFLGPTPLPISLTATVTAESSISRSEIGVASGLKTELGEEEEETDGEEKRGNRDFIVRPAGINFLTKFKPKTRPTARIGQQCHDPILTVESSGPPPRPGNCSK